MFSTLSSRAFAAIQSISQAHQDYLHPFAWSATQFPVVDCHNQECSLPAPARRLLDLPRTRLWVPGAHPRSYKAGNHQPSGKLRRTPTSLPSQIKLYDAHFSHRQCVARKTFVVFKGNDLFPHAPSSRSTAIVACDSSSNGNVLLSHLPPRTRYDQLHAPMRPSLAQLGPARHPLTWNHGATNPRRKSRNPIGANVTQNSASEVTGHTR